MREIGIAQVAPIGIKPAHGLGEVMVRDRRPGARLLIPRAVEYRHHVQNADATGTGRRRGNDVISLVVAFQRNTFDSLVVAKVVQANQATVLLHGRGQQVRRLALVEIIGSQTGNAPKRARKFRLTEILMPAIEFAVF